MDQLDAVLTKAINGLAGQSAMLDTVLVWTSNFGAPILVFLVAMQWWKAEDRTHHRHVLLATGLSFLVGLALNQVILLLVHRMRPYDAGISHLLIAPSADPSFPSDHATATFAIAASLLLQCLRRQGAWFLDAALLMSFARVYVGIHYLGDVLGGALTGIIAAVIVTTLLQEGTRLDRLLTRIL